jgi:hypothetical protein
MTLIIKNERTLSGALLTIHGYEWTQKTPLMITIGFLEDGAISKMPYLII